MKKILAMLLSVAIIATIAISGTIAYFTDTESATNVFTVGNVNIELLEQERTLDAEGKPDNGELKDFTQGKKLMPIVGSAQGEKDQWGLVTYDAARNYQDKIVRVKNIGDNDAYVRIFVAVPTALESDIGTPALNALHWNIGNRFDVTKSSCYNSDDNDNDYKNEFGSFMSLGTKKINSITYNVYSFTRKKALKPGDTSAAAFVGFYLDSKVDYNDVDGKYYLGDKNVSTNVIDFDLSQPVYIPVYAEAVQAAGFDSPYTAFSSAIEPSPSDNPYHPWKEGITYFPGYTNVSNDEELKAALSANTESITVNLTADVCCDVDSATQYTNAMGGASTKTVTINGNGHKVSFIHPDSDANHIVTNGAKLVIQNATITNSGYNEGPWNRHDLVFDCDVVLNNVASEKALAFGGNATLNNVSVSDSGAYALWIKAEGQTVNIDGLEVNMSSDGRGIAIKDQYVSFPAKVTLNVKDASFSTQSKAAILVTSTAGADINLSGTIDLANVAADKTNEVWVDKAYVASDALVTVTGGSKINEP